jgi:hypothetical protein
MGQVIAIVVGAVVSVVFVLAAVAQVLAWLGFTPNGPRIVARIWARVRSLWARMQARRRRVEELEQQVADLTARLEAASAPEQPPAQTPPGVISVADYIKQSTPRSTDELMEQQSRDTGNHEPSA